MVFMDSGSSSTPLSEKPPQRLANIAGTVIALVTLLLPALIIAHYSSGRVSALPSATYLWSPLRE